jgi:FtsP/CotA-like multicopper oxidase with cupredoxin domain
LSSDRRRLVVALLATTAVLAPLGWFWQASLVPDTYSVMDMGYVDAGGGEVAAGHRSHSAHQRSVDDLTADPGRAADVRMTLTARQQRFRLASGQQVDGYTLNGSSPGPLVRARQGELVEVRLVNEDVGDGVTLHWHGVDVPNAMDGVAGVTQDAVRPGESFTYRFVAEDPGTYWYHSHQVSHEQVQGGLLGALVVDPVRPAGGAQDELALLHVYDGVATVNGAAGDVRVDAPDGRRVRVRVLNTDNGSVSVWSSGAYRVLAVDGTDVHEPPPVEDRALRLTAGGRADLEVVAPARIELGGAAALVVGDGAVAAPQPDEELDLLSYGRPQPLAFDAEDADRRFGDRVGRRPGFLDGRPGF